MSVLQGLSEIGASEVSKTGKLLDGSVLLLPVSDTASNNTLAEPGSRQ